MLRFSPGVATGRGPSRVCDPPAARRCAGPWLASLGALLVLVPLAAPAAPNPTGAIAHATSCALPGDEVLVRVFVNNTGDEPACDVPFRVRLSGDEQLDDADVEVDSGTLGICIPAGQGRTRFSAVPLPADTAAPSQVYLLLEVNPGGVVAGDDPDDNLAVSLPLRVDTRADLEVVGAGIDLPSGCVFGLPVAVSVQVRNTGCVPAAGFTTELQLDAGGAAAPLVLARTPAPCEVDADCGELPGGPGTCEAGRCTGTCVAEADCAAPVAACLEERCTNAVFPGETVTLELEGVLPEGLPDGTYGLVVAADAGGDVEEIDEAEDPVDPLGPVECTGPHADGVLTRLQVAAQGVAGEQLLARRALANRGFEAGSFTVAYLLSLDEVVDPGDALLAPVHDESIELSPGEADDDSLYLQVPASVPAGTYRLLAVVDPDGVVPELSENNNTRVSEGLLELRGATLRVATNSLPEAIAQVPYQQQLTAQGGAGAYLWSASGLPPGLAITGDGLLTGRPTGVGTYAVSVGVESGRARASADFELVVRPYTPPLGSTTRTLPVGFVGQPYLASLTAEGGTPPYTWSTVGRPPAGLSLEGDRVEGTPQVAGCTPWTLTLTDAGGTVIRAELELCVVENALRLLDARLADGVVGVAYQQVLRAEGGLPPYTFSLGGIDGTGLSLEARSDTSVALVGVPVRAGAPAVLLRVSDRAGLSAEARLSLVIEGRRVTVAGRELPPARAGEVYVGAQLEADLPALIWDLQAGALPPGLSLATDGWIDGTVPADAEPGGYSFVVLASDGVGGEGLAAFGITVLPALGQAPSDAPRGCCGGGGASAAVLPGLALALLRRRRHPAARC